MKKCPICSDPRGLRWTRAVLNGEKGIKEFCDVFGVTEDEAWEHIYEHQMEFEEDEEEKKEFDVETRLKRIVEILEQRIDLLTDTWNVDLATVRSLTALVSELRKTIMSYAELQGKIQRGVINVKIENYEMKLNQLIQIVMEDVCDECRRKIAERFT